VIFSSVQGPGGCFPPLFLPRGHYTVHRIIEEICDPAKIPSFTYRFSRVRRYPEERLREPRGGRSVRLHLPGSLQTRTLGTASFNLEENIMLGGVSMLLSQAGKA
jgi:hypothetical protein